MRVQLVGADKEGIIKVGSEQELDLATGEGTSFGIGCLNVYEVYDSMDMDLFDPNPIACEAKIDNAVKNEEMFNALQRYDFEEDTYKTEKEL